MVRDPSGFSEVTMGTGRTLALWLSAWIVAVGATLGSRLALAGYPLSTREFVIWGLVGCMPMATAWMLWGARSGDSIAQVLYDVEHPTDRAGGTSRDVRRG
jgi:hypothetical protein